MVIMDSCHKDRRICQGKEPPMGSILFKHNQEAYEAAASMLEETGQAAVIHPTGTGKSFIAFRLCEDKASGRICWLSPSEYIFMTQMEQWDAAGGGKLQNIQFFTYARLMRMDGEKMKEIKPDYIILDEFHRCGAAQWGGGVERLRGLYPDAKVLGLSATNIRYLDNQRDMAWELFGGNIASELTLGAAVVQGILPAPKYVLSVYSYRKELRKYELRVRQARNKTVRDAAEKELEALRRALEKADGLPEVFARHMKQDAFDSTANITGTKNRLIQKKEKALQPSSCGKYIVFCADYGHLLNMQELAKEWFAYVDDAPHIYTAYSDYQETSGEFEAFKADTSPHLKLLYCIDMLNEGIHIDGVDGVILLRPTVSPTIYKQQIGRALAAGGKKSTVIFDIVMNIENLCSIGAIEEELREAVFDFRINGRSDEIVTDHFRVIDEMADCRRLFLQLNDTLNASWEAMYGMAKEYYAEHGNLKVPAAYTTQDGHSLGAWVATQRKVYNGKTAGSLNTQQIKRLDEIGMCWQSTQEASWEQNFAEAEKYFLEHGNLDIPAGYTTGNGCALGRWIRRQREIYQRMLLGNGQKGYVAPGRQSIHAAHAERLSRIGMVWENPDSWERRFALAKQYYEEHGNLKMPADIVVEGIWLGRWLREQRVKLAKEDGQSSREALSEEQKQKLFSIGIRPGMTPSELSWREQYGKAAEFYQEHGNLAVPKRYTAGNGKKLGIWLSHQRAGHRKGVLASWQVQLLDGIGMVWESGNLWEQGYAYAAEYFRMNGHLAVPNTYVCPDGYRLGKWISNQRQAYSSARGLDEEKIHRLEEIGMAWSAKRGRRTNVASQKEISDIYK